MQRQVARAGAARARGSTAGRRGCSRWRRRPRRSTRRRHRRWCDPGRATRRRSRARRCARRGAERVLKGGIDEFGKALCVPSARFHLPPKRTEPPCGCSAGGQSRDFGKSRGPSQNALQDFGRSCRAFLGVGVFGEHPLGPSIDLRGVRGTPLGSVNRPPGCSGNTPLGGWDPRCIPET